jgi:NNP family nitrate/nitrite transporter-like MFS transporter
MAAAAAVVLVTSGQRSLPLFYVDFIALFALSGLGNGSTYKMIPAVFAAPAGGADAGRADAGHDSRGLAGAAIGIAGAIGAFGGVLVNIAFRQSFLATKTGTPAYIGFIAFYVICLAVTWQVYLRRSGRGLAAV